MAEYLADIVTDYYFWGALGFFIGCFFSIPNQMKSGSSFPASVITIVAGIYGGLLGTRILYIIIQAPGLFLERPLLALAFWQGGLAWQGGLVAGMLGIMAAAAILRRPLWESAGSIAPGLALAHAITRTGCLFRGCCYGSPCTLPWAISSERLSTRVHPTQVYSMIGEIAAFGILQYLWKKPENRKYLYPLYILLFSIHRFIQEFFRGVPAGPEWISGLRVYQSICIVLFAFALCCLLVLRYRKKGAYYSAPVAAATFLAFIIFHPEDTVRTPRTLTGKENLYIVVTGKMFSEVLEPWQKMREDDGFEIAVIERKRSISAEEIQKRIREISGGSCRYILLVGDCGEELHEKEPWHIPSVFVSSQKAGVQKEYPSDALFGDLDNDGIPDVPVGRLPARNVTMLRRMITKIRKYRDWKIDENFYRAVIWSGARGYHHQMHEIALSMLSDHPSLWLNGFLISGKIESVYSGYPPEQADVFLNQMEHPAFITLVASHGSFRSVNPTEYKGKEIFLSNEHVSRLRENLNPAGPMFFVGCNSGEFQHPEKDDMSLGEAFIRVSAGPCVVVAASGPTHPVTNYFFTGQMLEILEKGPVGAGDYLLGIQREICRRGKDTIAEISQGDLRASMLFRAVPEREKDYLYTPGAMKHEVLRYNLLGDPAINMRIPQKTDLNISLNEKQQICAQINPETSGGVFIAQKIYHRSRRPDIARNLSPERRRELFREANRPPEILMREDGKESGETICFDWRPTVKTQSYHLRFLVFRNGRAYYDAYSPSR